MHADTVAARWFVLRLDDAPTTREDRVRWRVAWVAAFVATAGEWFRDGKRRALIEVIRRDDDTVVATFPETGERPISERLLELREDVVEDELVR